MAHVEAGGEAEDHNESWALLPRAGCGACKASSPARTLQMPTRACGEECLSLRVGPAAALGLWESLTLRVYTECSPSPGRCPPCGCTDEQAVELAFDKLSLVGKQKTRKRVPCHARMCTPSFSRSLFSGLYGRC